MKLKTKFTWLFVVFCFSVSAQQKLVDSLVHVPSFSSNDTLQLITNSILAEDFAETNPDSAIYYAEKAVALSKGLGFKLEEVGALGQIGYAQLNLGNYPRSLQTLLSALEIAENPATERKVIPHNFPGVDELSERTGSAHNQRLDKQARIHQYLGILYDNMNNYEKGKYHYLVAKNLARQTGNLPLQSIINGTLGRVYMYLKNLDSALIVQQESYDLALKADYKKYRGSILLNLARIYSARGNKKSAADYFRRALATSEEQNYLRGVVAANLYLADLYLMDGQRDSGLYFISEGKQVAQQLNAPSLLLRSYTALASFYRTESNNDSIVKYQTMIIKINDSLFNSKQGQQFQNITYDQQQRQLEKEAAEKDYQYKLRTYGLLTGLGIFLLLAIVLFRNNKNKQKAYSLLVKQKQETDFQKAKVERTLEELKSTQNQLIQSEKMASLGELTAGIAHEIQNPLNFINNFSEVNAELIDEMSESLASGNNQQAAEIGKNIKENEEKISHHGKRADAIVKSMLQHSRAGSGQKEAVDVNALADEYLRLAYHGLRAKEKSFNAKFESVLDPSITPINVNAQDIGRVILNLINNAFYAATEKKNSGAIPGFEPTVILSTKKLDGSIEIRVRDNGNGVPQKVIDKIFQPFFTTKPTGLGTGLGLSLSYDIITNGHGGELKVETEEGKYSEFIINLPL